MTLPLGSGGTPVQVQVLSPAPIINFSKKSGFLLGKLDFLLFHSILLQKAIYSKRSPFPKQEKGERFFYTCCLMKSTLERMRFTAY